MSGSEPQFLNNLASCLRLPSIILADSTGRIDKRLLHPQVSDDRRPSWPPLPVAAGAAPNTR